MIFPSWTLAPHMFLLSCSYQLPVPAPKCTRPISGPHIIWPLPQPPHVLLLRVAQSSLSWRWARVARSREPDVFLAPLCRSCQLASHCCGEGGGVSFGYEANVWPSTKGRLLDPVTSSHVAYFPSVGSGFQPHDVEDDFKSLHFCLQWCTRSQCGVVR